MTRSPSFQFYPDKALAGSDHLSGDAFKAYWKVLWWMWLHAEDYCSIPNTDPAWITATGIHEKDKLNAVKSEIMQPHFPMLKVNGDLLVSNGLKKEAEKQAKRSLEAKRSAKYRWCNKLQSKRTHSERNKTASKIQCSPTPSPTPIPTTYKELVGSDDFKSAWDMFCRHRIEIKKPMTIHAAELLLSDCNKWGPRAAIEAINQSIRSRWSGLFLPKQFQKQSSGEKEYFI